MKVSVRKPRLFKSPIKKSGMPPGTLVHVGEQKTEAVRITYMDYDEQKMQEKQVASIEECFPFKACLLYTSPSPRDRTRSRMPSSA